ncbi:MAG: hypothetical protein G01um101416_918 [Microgenomates group bacterium Gr01-1014_16]|nr:MAG: hypothetical protein G01um101416_918 [Microgenomates group bacterium Gr01-1014_16]
MTAEIRMSRWAASRKARCSASVKMRGALDSYLGWVRGELGLWVCNPDSWRNLKKVFKELILRLMLLGV